MQNPGLQPPTLLPAAPSAREHGVAFAIIFPAVFLAHAWLLKLPYFWDETGYFIPAARDLLLTGDLIPGSTLSNAHPPLLMIWLAASWKIFGYSPLVTRSAMLLIASFTLLGIWRLGCLVANRSVAIAAVACTAFYPVFFAQSSLAHLDMLVAALTLWGLAFYLEGRRAWAIGLLTLAPLAKETAIITPLVLLSWELVCPVLAKFWGKDVCPAKTGLRNAAWFLLAAVPLWLWFTYHHHRTGYFLGNPEYLRYNLLATVNPLRIALAVITRLWHTLGYMNLFVLTILAAVSLRGEASTDRKGPPTPRWVAGVFLAVIASHILGLAILGGAVLARYMIPVIPLVILMCVASLYRRLTGWQVALGFVLAAFLAGIFFNPPYRFAPEDNLTYSDYVLLHQRAAEYVAAHNHGERVLTAWPASDELTKPYLGYVSSSIPVVRIDNFSEPQMQLAAAAAGQYSWLYMFSTKYEPPRLLMKWGWWNRILERFFDYHVDVGPELAAAQLGGKVVYGAHRRGEWVVLIRIEGAENAAVATRKLAARGMQAARPTARSW